MNKSLKIALISTIIFFGIIGSYIIWEETQYEPVDSNQPTFDSIQPSFSPIAQPTSQPTTQPKTGSQEKLYSGSINGIPYTNWTADEVERVKKTYEEGSKIPVVPTFTPDNTPITPNLPPETPVPSPSCIYLGRDVFCNGIPKGHF